MNDILKYELGGIAALTELGTLAAYSQGIIDTRTTAEITKGIGISVATILLLPDLNYEPLKNMKKNANEIYHKLIKG